MEHFQALSQGVRAHMLWRVCALVLCCGCYLTDGLSYLLVRALMFCIVLSHRCMHVVHPQWSACVFALHTLAMHVPPPSVFSWNLHAVVARS